MSSAVEKLKKYTGPQLEVLLDTPNRDGKAYYTKDAFDTLMTVPNDLMLWLLSNGDSTVLANANNPSELLNRFQAIQETKGLPTIHQFNTGYDNLQAIIDAGDAKQEEEVQILLNYLQPAQNDTSAVPKYAIPRWVIDRVWSDSVYALYKRLADQSPEDFHGKLVGASFRTLYELHNVYYRHQRNSRNYLTSYNDIVEQLTTRGINVRHPAALAALRHTPNKRSEPLTRTPGQILAFADPTNPPHNININVERYYIDGSVEVETHDYDAGRRRARPGEGRRRAGGNAVAVRSNSVQLPIIHGFSEPVEEEDIEEEQDEAEEVLPNLFRDKQLLANTMNRLLGISNTEINEFWFNGANVGHTDFQEVHEYDSDRLVDVRRIPSLMNGQETVFPSKLPTPFMNPPELLYRFHFTRIRDIHYNTQLDLVFLACVPWIRYLVLHHQDNNSFHISKVAQALYHLYYSFEHTDLSQEQHTRIVSLSNRDPEHRIIDEMHLKLWDTMVAQQNLPLYLKALVTDHLRPDYMVIDVKACLPLELNLVVKQSNETYLPWVFMAHTGTDLTRNFYYTWYPFSVGPTITGEHAMYQVQAVRTKNELRILVNNSIVQHFEQDEHVGIKRNLTTMNEEEFKKKRVDNNIDWILVVRVA